MPTLMYPVLAPLARLSARSLPGNVPATSSRPPTTAASVTLPEVRLALNAVSTAPVTGSSFATPRRATLLTVAQVPPAYIVPPTWTNLYTAPLATLGVKLAGLALTTTPSAGAAPATIGTVATTRPSPIATSVVRSVRFPSETMAPPLSPAEAVLPCRTGHRRQW